MRVTGPAARKGYDLASGWGTVDVNAFATALSQQVTTATAQAQVLAMSTGRTLKAVPEAIVRRVAAQEAAGRAESARLHLESVKRVLARDEPAFLA